MAYIGSTPTTQSFTSGTDYFNGTGSQTAFTLSRSVNSVNDIEAVVNNVVQQPNTAYTLSGTTLTFTSAPSSGTSNIYVRYLSTTTQTIATGQNTVGLSQLTTDMQNTIGSHFKNRIINGAMAIDQRNAGASITANGGAYTLDRWISVASNNSVFSVQQNAGSVTPPAGFKNYLGCTSLAATSVGTSGYYLIGQYVEGYNVADMGFGSSAALTFTISFWVRSSLTGNFGGFVANSNDTRVYPISYSISSANTWEQKTITIAGDTTGTWLSTNGTGLKIVFSLGSGSNNVGTANTWTSTGYNGTSGQVNVVSTNGATFYITGVQLEKGSTATNYDVRPYGTELNLCQRYFEMNFPQGTAPANGVSDSSTDGFKSGLILSAADMRVGNIPFKATKRATPTITIYRSNAGATNSAWNYFSGSWVDTPTTPEKQNENGFGALMTPSGRTAYQAYIVTGFWTASAEL